MDSPATTTVGNDVPDLATARNGEQSQFSVARRGKTTQQSKHRGRVRTHLPLPLGHHALLVHFFGPAAFTTSPSNPPPHTSSSQPPTVPVEFRLMLCRPGVRSV